MLVILGAMPHPRGHRHHGRMRHHQGLLIQIIDHPAAQPAEDFPSIMDMRHDHGASSGLIRKIDADFPPLPRIDLNRTVHFLLTFAILFHYSHYNAQLRLLQEYLHRIIIYPSSFLISERSNPIMKKRYSFAGASRRGHYMYANGILKHFADSAEIAGVYDINRGRSEYFAKHTGAKVYDDFEEMLNTEKPDAVIVTTVDAYHSDYIIRAMEMGYDVITEKPMTIDAERCQKILDTEKKTGKKLTVTFNYRYSPYTTRIKELLTEGVIGDVYSVHFEWSLDRSLVLSGHGSSYYRRWNSVMDKSGGLLVHKSTHHFDMVNWFLNDSPARVGAFAKMNVYGPKNAPWADCGETCRVCPHAQECEFYYEQTEEEVGRYQNNEHLDGYHKDACVYRDEVNIYDTMAVLVEYRGGALLSYSLNSTAAYEGWKMIINGSK
ncbi:MAG: Gfo/Idh/MocA family oxidoreductase, partial [Clostridiales bacterium]|nr:Gfo/Idh/MocA family oxidoreductase [Clostridiales bacterium]